jgi:allantoinase
MSLAITGGTIVAEYGVFRGDLLVQDGRIVSLGETGSEIPSGWERIDATGLTLLPGGVDPHCHFREPGYLEREGWRTGSMAAAAGGVTTVLEYPQAEPPVTDMKTLSLKRARAEAESVVDFGLWGGAIEIALPHLAAMHGGGVVGFKAFMHTRNPSFPGVDDGLILDILDTVADLRSVFALHCENAAIQVRNIAKLEDAHRVYPLAHAESRPPIVEYEAVARFLLLAASVSGARIHVPHVSLSTVGDLIRDAKRAGLPVSAEACPQHLLLDEDDLVEQGVWAKCGPPLRSRQNVDALWSHVLDGTIDYHASDHAPTTREEKEAGLENIFRASTGVINNQWAIPLIIDEAFHRRGMTLDHLARYTATNAAKRLGLYPRKGSIRVGADADLALYDLSANQTIDQERQLNRQKWTPWHGRTLGVKVMRTIVRGRTVYDGLAITAPPGHGIYVDRAYGSRRDHLTRPAMD